MEETKKLAIPDGYEFDRVEGGEVILKKKEVVLPKTWNECYSYRINTISNYHVPMTPELLSPIGALCKLIICRNVWWKQLGWKPDWRDKDEKYCIRIAAGEIGTEICYGVNHILAFPTEEVCAHFYVAFKDLIEEAKELL